MQPINGLTGLFPLQAMVFFICPYVNHCQDFLVCRFVHLKVSQAIVYLLYACHLGLFFIVSVFHATMSTCCIYLVIAYFVDWRLSFKSSGFSGLLKVFARVVESSTLKAFDLISHDDKLFFAQFYMCSKFSLHAFENLLLIK